jgi:hypothetical protein
MLINELCGFAVAKFHLDGLGDKLCKSDVPEPVRLEVTVEPADGTDFEGTDIIRLINEGNKK